ncbi:Putative general secretion pathway L-type yghE [Gossypium arboreum]|uniref:Putative general secretion pathway L-type yghE n=1 Tax=Gossypium arboreum TaxID=29729 RepID=A0A0B0MXP1_GOSAR|nr:Putative general secretion pathway L-type yghE [Gossypium arboreum]KHG21349.1 Putative general secretion pathway L-type yghE [Gossypium arboreum]
MLSGKDNSGFSWDEHRQMSHKDVSQFRHCNFPYYDQLTSIYAKDQATGNDAQTTADIVEEIDIEDVATTDNLEERNNYRGCEDDVSLDEMDVSAIQSQPPKPNQDGSTSSKKKKKMNDGIAHISTSITNAAMLLGEIIRIVGLELSRSIHALRKIPDHPTQMLMFLVYLLQLDWNG